MADPVFFPRRQLDTDHRLAGSALPTSRRPTLGVLRRRLGRTPILSGPFRHQRLSDRKLTRTPQRTGLTNLALLRRLSATEPIPGAMGHRISLHFLSRQGDQRPGPQRLFKPLCQLGYPRHSIIGQKPGRSSDVCIVGAASRLDQ